VFRCQIAGLGLNLYISKVFAEGLPVVRGAL
jgi:hypothetical protein